MNYRPYPSPKSQQGERVIPLLTGFALGASFWGSLGRQSYYPYPYPYPYQYPYAYPYRYPYYRPYRRRRWY